MNRILIDIRYALRRLAKTPRSTALGLSVLVGGLFISLFTFSVVYTAVYKPLPLPGGDSIYSLSTRFGSLPSYEFLQIRDQIAGLEETGVWRDTPVRLSLGETGRTLLASRVEASIFEFTSTVPSMGRTLRPEDAESGAPRVVAISYRIWTTVFDSDPEVLDRSLRIDNEETSVVGVLPEGFRFPTSTDLWLPLSEGELDPLPESHGSLRSYARLAPGASIDEIGRDLTEKVDRLYQEGVRLYDKPDHLDHPIRIFLETFPRMASGSEEGALGSLTLNLVAGCILLLACINVGNLFLVRALERTRETAIRSALGAPRLVLVFQLMWEGVLVSGLGLVLALLLVGAALETFNFAMQSQTTFALPFWWVWGIDVPTVFVALLLTGLIVFLTCFVPAWRASGDEQHSRLRDFSYGGQGFVASRFSGRLVVVQVCLISLLLMCGGVLVAVMKTAVDFESGFDTENLVEFKFDLQEAESDRDRTAALYSKLAEVLRSRPEILDAHAEASMGRALTVVGGVESSDRGPSRIDLLWILGSPEFRGIRQVAGRLIDSRDGPADRPVAVISQSMAERFWPGESPLERQIEVQIAEQRALLAIVGVVSDVSNGGFIFDPVERRDEIYISGLQFAPNRRPKVYFKFAGDSARALETMHQALFSVRSEARVRYVDRADELQARLGGVILVAFRIVVGAGLFSLLMAISGIYGVTASSVVRRTREIGVRRALGASDTDVIRWLMQQSGRRVVIGLSWGLGLFALVAWAFFNFGSDAVPLHYLIAGALAVTGLLGGVIFLAVYVPTRRAIALEPSVALRCE